MKIALALGGGAALGWAHIGVLRALEQHRVETAAVAGTSIGALVAVYAAAGRIDELEQFAREVRGRTVLRHLDPYLKRGAWIGGGVIARRLERDFGAARFEDFDLPCAVVASDLASGEAVIIDRGPVVPALLASMALPGIFPAVSLDGRMLIDGGLAMPVPVAAVRRIAGDLPLVAVSLLDDYPRRAQAIGVSDEAAPTPTSLGVLRAGTALLLSQLSRHSLALDPPDLALSLPVGHVGVSDFTRADELIEIGRRATAGALASIRALDPESSA